MRKFIGFFLFILTGSLLLVNSFHRTNNIPCKILLIGFGFFYFIGLTDHFKEIFVGGNGSGNQRK